MTMVFVADDSPVARLSLVRALRGAGFSTVEAASVYEGLEMDLAGVEIAVLDLDLGDGTGIELFHAVREKRGPIPVAFFTSGGPEADLTEAKALAPVFRKPDDLAQVVAWAEKVKAA